MLFSCSRGGSDGQRMDGAKDLSHAVNLFNNLSFRVGVSLLFILIALSETRESKVV
ncbi:hypothetical protein Mapa_015539 [Marchantia paleacea]|nr:hypothetical protein Mapa_015539 [Marchantia paleacea]